MSTGEKITLTVTVVSLETIEGLEEGRPGLVRVQVDQVDKVERREFNLSKTALLIGLAIVVVLVGVVAAAIASAPADLYTSSP